MSFNESTIDLEDVYNYISISDNRQELLGILRKSEMQIKTIERKQDEEKQSLVDAGYIVDED